jgi:hypothetical protein
MASDKNLQELFHETLKDIYFAEKKILSALPKMAKAAQSTELKAAFEKHETETEEARGGSGRTGTTRQDRPANFFENGCRAGGASRDFAGQRTKSPAVVTVYWKCCTPARMSAGPYGFAIKRLPEGKSLLCGGATPVTTIKWIGGHLSLIAAANRSPSIEPGMLISVITSSISRSRSSTSIASSASNVAMTLCPPLSKIPRKYSLIRNSSSTVKININSKQLFDNFVPDRSPSKVWIF